MTENAVTEWQCRREWEGWHRNCACLRFPVAEKLNGMIKSSDVSGTHDAHMALAASMGEPRPWQQSSQAGTLRCALRGQSQQKDRLNAAEQLLLCLLPSVVHNLVQDGLSWTPPPQATKAFFPVSVFTIMPIASYLPSDKSLGNVNLMIPPSIC